MRNKTGPVADAEVFFVGKLFYFLKQIPYRWAVGVSYRLLWVILGILSKRRRLMADQIQKSFPDLPPQARHQIIRDSLQNLARGIALFPRIPDLIQKGAENTVAFEGAEHLESALREGRGAITFTAHYGCWEMMAVYITRKYPKVSMVVRPLDNPGLDAIVSRVRQSGGGGVIDSRKVLKEGIRLLRDNGVLGVLIDQNFYKGGVFVDFLGRWAATNVLVPVLARRTGCVVLPMHNVWVNNKIKIICEPPVALSKNPDQVQAIQEDTQTLTRYVEKWVREDPGQWLWLHNRWKRRPTEEELATCGRSGGR